MRKIEIPTDKPTEFGETAADIQRRRKEREQRERDEAEKQQREEMQREEDRRVETSVTDKVGSGQKDQELRGVKVKWTQRVERPTHLLSVNLGARKNI